MLWTGILGSLVGMGFASTQVGERRRKKGSKSKCILCRNLDMGMENLGPVLMCFCKQLGTSLRPTMVSCMVPLNFSSCLHTHTGTSPSFLWSNFRLHSVREVAWDPGVPFSMLERIKQDVSLYHCKVWHDHGLLVHLLGVPSIQQLTLYNGKYGPCIRRLIKAK